MDPLRTAEDVLNEKGGDLVTVPPETTIREAARRMKERKIGAVLVRKEGKIVGIWTERDLLYDLADEGFDPTTAVIGDYMTTELVSCPYNTHIYALADKILGLRLRHLLIERDGEYIGLLSSGDILRASLQLRTEQLKELDKIVQLEYYDQWRWRKKQKK